jgi:hypothetical protein
VIAVTRLRQIGDKTSIETGYYISSRLGTAESLRIYWVNWVL